MDTETMIRELRNLQEKHKNDRVFTFETRWADVCRDVADRLEKLQCENAELKNAPKDAGRFIGYGDRGKLIVGDNEYDVYLGSSNAYAMYEHGRARTIHKFILVEI